MSSEMYRKGMEKRRSILGDAYVNAAVDRPNQWNKPFQEMITEAVWGHVWSRPGLDDRTRNLINVALMIALDRPNELRLYIKARHNTGATLQEIAEVVHHATVYCGVPAGLEAFKELEKALAEEDGL
ncbi:carboxymuconolactone decarboxylase family protein [Bordetella genomosp. 11]|uniref:4-carboxymuconolactone decarboxylase n=1 Tax=Bordetella genomosp. 11 TaxID=1416808 RepID=A0A261UJN2_9BORD|nr:carboxymuconolactone decarboxylase family protein [Bordetella genomosp. 11]OZI61815.1 4-carboxymuconolactone decarboxylase [Bordetella genomosp. 11]